jgi:hypothetical protein
LLTGEEVDQDGVFLPLSTGALVQAVLPFVPWADWIEKVVVVVAAKHNECFSLREAIPKALNGHIPFPIDVMALPAESCSNFAGVIHGLKGQTDSMKSGCALFWVSGCCSRGIDVAPLFYRMHTGPSTIVLGRSMEGCSLANQTLVSVRAGVVTSVAIGTVPPCPGELLSVQGPVYFQSVARLLSIVDGAPALAAQAPDAKKALPQLFEALDLEPAETRMVAMKTTAGEVLPLKTPQATVFLDLDGTLIPHEPKPSYNHPMKMLPGASERLAELSNTHMIILTTARPEAQRSNLVSALQGAGIKYQSLVMGLPSGHRLLVNDVKPSTPFNKAAIAVEVERDVGIGGHGFEVRTPRLEVLRNLSAGSGAVTFLMKDLDSGKRFVRKACALHGHEDTLKRLQAQKQSIERYSLYPCKAPLVPRILAESQGSLEYYFDLEFLDGYTELAEYPRDEQMLAVTAILPHLEKTAFQGRWPAPSTWLQDHLQTKVFSRLEKWRTDVDFKEPGLQYLLNSSEVVINGKTYPSIPTSLATILSSKDAARLQPKWIGHCHGDLNFENILWNAEEQSFRLIDMDGALPFDAPELDVGKMFQSLVSGYESWSRVRSKLCTYQGEGSGLSARVLWSEPSQAELEQVCGLWAGVLGCSAQDANFKGRFFVGEHLIRMVPFRRKCSVDQATMALVVATVQFAKAQEMMETP